jgi:hypothetical protein
MFVVSHFEEQIWWRKEKISSMIGWIIYQPDKANDSQ